MPADPLLVVEPIRVPEAFTRVEEKAAWPADYRLSAPWWADRWCALALGIGTGLPAGGLIAYFVFNASPQNPAPAWSILVPFAAAVVLWQVVPRPAFPRRVALDGGAGAIVIRMSRGPERRVPVGEVVLVAERRALAVGSGSIFPPRVLRLGVAGGGDLLLRFPVSDEPFVACLLADSCHNAVLLPVAGDPVLPVGLVAIDRDATIGSARGVISGELSAQVRRAAVVAALLLAVTAGVAVLLYSHFTGPAASGGRPRPTTKAVMVGAVALAMGTTVAVHTIGIVRRARRVDRDLAAGRFRTAPGDAVAAQ